MQAPPHIMLPIGRGVARTWVAKAAEETRRKCTTFRAPDYTIVVLQPMCSVGLLGQAPATSPAQQCSPTLRFTRPKPASATLPSLRPTIDKSVPV